MNAKKELLEALGNLQIKCATIEFYGKVYDLPMNYTQEEYTNFLVSLDTTYYHDYRGLGLQGTVWLTDGQWMARVIVEWGEGWNLMSSRLIPKRLQNAILVGYTHEGGGEYSRLEITQGHISVISEMCLKVNAETWDEIEANLVTPSIGFTNYFVEDLSGNQIPTPPLF